MLYILASYTVFLIYLGMGYLVYNMNPKGIYNRLFKCLCIIFAACSMLEILKVNAHNPIVMLQIQQLSKIIWLNYPAIMLQISLYITHEDWYLKKLKKVIKYLYLPGILLSVCELIISDTFITPETLRIFEWISLYSYIALCLFLFLKRYFATKILAEKKSIRIILGLGIIATSVAAFNDFTLSPRLLSLDQFIAFFFIIGALFLNYRYKFYKVVNLISVDDIVDSISEMVFVVDLEGKIIGLNRKAEKVLGYKEESLHNSCLEKVVNFDFSATIRKLNAYTNYFVKDDLFCTAIDGKRIPVSAKISAIKDNQYGGLAGIIVILNDKTLIMKLQAEIKERVNRETQLSYLGIHDSLTGLYNRNYFSQMSQKLQQEHNTSMGVIMCDLDGLKLINDTLGHDQGDKLLVEAARILSHSSNGAGTPYRIGGDEFAILVSECDDSYITLICDKIHNSMKKYNSRNNDIPLSISIGFSLCRGLPKSVNELLKEADSYMYREKLYNTHSIRSSMVQALTKTLEARDFITEGHGERLRLLAIKLGKSMGLSEQRILDLQLLAQFHDIGKVGVPDSILFKPDALTESELIQMQRHCEIGYKIAQAYPDFNNISDLILKHHERWDGTGYPLGLDKENIPLECRIIAVLDAHDAMVNDRPYRKGMPEKEAIEELKRNAGKQFDSRVVQEFLKMKCNSISI